MKKNEERILKFLSELMSENERLDFEKELANSDELKSDLASIKNPLEEACLPKTIEVDERYFANLLPRVRKRLEKKSKIISWKSAYYFTPTAAAVVILSFLLFSSKVEFDTQYKELADEVVNNFSDQEVSGKYFAELESNPADIILTTNSGEFSIQIPSEVEITRESYTRLIDNPVSEDYRTLSGLSEKQLEIIYEKMNSTTSQKVTK
jgi:hypothetical protein